MILVLLRGDHVTTTEGRIYIYNYIYVKRVSDAIYPYLGPPKGGGSSDSAPSYHPYKKKECQEYQVPDTKLAHVEQITI